MKARFQPGFFFARGDRAAGLTRRTGVGAPEKRANKPVHSQAVRGQSLLARPHARFSSVRGASDSVLAAGAPAIDAATQHCRKTQACQGVRKTSRSLVGIVNLVRTRIIPTRETVPVAEV
jgi:hypothetical protein